MEGGREEKNNRIVSNRCLEFRIFGICEDKGIGVADNVEYLGIDIMNLTGELGKKGKRIIKKTETIQKGLHGDRHEHSSEDGIGVRKSMGIRSPRHGLDTKRNSKNAMGQCSRKEALSLALVFLGDQQLEIEHELTCASTCFWHKQPGCGTRRAM